MKLNRSIPFLIVALLPSVCLADGTADKRALNTDSGGLVWIDWLIIGVYAALTIGLGWFYSRRQRTKQEYFTGSGRMNPILIGVSLFATLLSTISYLSMPGESLGKGPVNMTTMFAYPFVFLIVAYGLLPLYMKYRVTSAYELLEMKLGLSVRLLGASMFLVLRLVWMSLLVYLTGKALTTMLDVGEGWIPLIVLVTSIVAVTYTSLGGLRAVVITDFAQTVLLFGGAILVLVTISIRMGGVSWFPTEWHATWDTQPIFSTNLATRVTVVGSILNFLVWYVCTTGGDQTSIQRFMATSDTRSARIAFATQLAVSVIVGVTLGMVGFALLGYFEANPHLLEGMSLKDDADKIFPRFIAFHLPVGVSGLVVAAMFAAAMSSIDSGVNSITAVVMTDFLDRFGLSPTSDKKHVRASRLLAISIGVIVVLCSSWLQYIPGNITAVTSKTSNLLTTPIFCLFFFALFVRFATPLGAWVGAFFGTLTAILIAFSGPLVVIVATYFEVDPELYGVVIEIDKTTGEEKIIDPISFQYIAPAAVLVNIGIGSIASLLSRGRTKSAT